MRRSFLLHMAAVLTSILGVSAVLLPLQSHLPGGAAVGALLLVAALLEMLVLGCRQVRTPGLVFAAAATLLAGLRLVLEPKAGFIPVLNSLIVWLFIRSVAFAVDGHRYAEPLKGRLLAVAATNLILAATLVSGLPIALMVTGLFGPTDELVASTAWILAVSFVATALLQLSLASQAPHMGQGRATIDRGGQNARGSST